MLVTSGVFTMEMEDLPGLLGSRPPRATDFSIAAIIGRSGRNAEVLKGKGKRTGDSTMRPLEKFVESTPGSMLDSPESLTLDQNLKEDMSILIDGRDSPDMPSSTSDSRDTIEVVHNEDSDIKSEGGGSPGKSNNSRSASSPSEKPTPKNPLLQEKCNCEELRHVVCHLETKDLWDKFHELGTEMIITKSGR
ncbi:unnamed protein product [Allacma fusca]|uniref:T-box domain-containing protein n=1 Tax=Allacma fusca TaxID=39272 RepID=A0A8J2L836_9HEXA|nr:unnamed protein product [Allacma fusca]